MYYFVCMKYEYYGKCAWYLIEVTHTVCVCEFMRLAHGDSVVHEAYGQTRISQECGLCDSVSCWMGKGHKATFHSNCAHVGEFALLQCFLPSPKLYSILLLAHIQSRADKLSICVCQRVM